MNFRRLFDDEPMAWPTLKEMVIAYIKFTLHRTENNKSRSCRILDIDKNTLYRWIRRASEVRND